MAGWTEVVWNMKFYTWPPLAIQHYLATKVIMKVNDQGGYISWEQEIFRDV